MRLHAVLLLALSSTVVVPVNSVRADPFHHQTVPLGERALGMGGAFTGVADDPSAVFYNPAGLSQLEDTALSASLTLNAFDQRTIERGYRTTEGEVDLEHKSQPTLPLFVSLVKQVGRKQADGSRKHAIAISTLTVDQRRLIFDAEIRTSMAAIARGEDPVFDIFKLEQEESTVWHGFSYSYRLFDNFSLGASGFLSLHRMRYDEEQITVTVGSVSDQGTYENPTTSLNMRQTSIDVKNLVGRIGALYVLPTDLGAFRFGAMFQPPSIKLSGSGKVHERRLFSDAIAGEAYGTYYDASDSGLSASAPEPWELRLGASYAPDASFLVALDGSVYGGVGTKSSPIRLIGAASPDPATGDPPQAGDLLVRDWYSKMTANASLGFEARIRDAVALRGGLFTDLSAAPNVPKTADVVVPVDINRYGAAFSIGLIAGGYDLSVGAAGLMGNGDGQAYDLVEGGFVRTPVEDRTLFVFISGAKSALTRLAKATYRKIRDRRRESQQNAGVEPSGAPAPSPSPAPNTPAAEEKTP